MSIALVHDNLWQVGGAERVLLALRELLPDAPVFTLGISAEVRRLLPDIDARPSFLQELPLHPDRLRRLAPLFPLGVRWLDLRGYDFVVSSSWGLAKAVRLAPGARHLCYCHSPLNWAWDITSYSEGEDLPFWSRAVLRTLAGPFRRWDRRTAQHVTRFVANSHYTAERIGRLYQRNSGVIPPPVDLGFWRPTRAKEDYAVVVSRLVPHKRVDLAISALATLDYPLRIVGEGRDRARLERLSSANVTFLGRVDDRTVRDVLSGARVTLVPGIEDFGLVTLESLACGTPVVARDLGGPREVIGHGSTGFLVKRASPESFAEATGAALQLETTAEALRASVQSFSLPVFLSRMAAVLAEMGVRTHAATGDSAPPPPSASSIAGTGRAEGDAARPPNA